MLLAYSNSYYIVVNLLIVVLLTTVVYSQVAEVMLIDGRTEGEGTILVKPPTHNSAWGFVCDDGWSRRAGLVVCRQLGYKYIRRVTRYNAFKTADKYDIVLDDVTCRGRESHIGQCRHSSWFRSDCTAREAAGVVCAGPRVNRQLDRPQKVENQTETLKDNSSRKQNQEMKDEPSEKLEKSKQSLKPAYPVQTNADNQAVNVKSVSINGGRNKNEGYVKVHLSGGHSGTICSDDWSLREAMVICKQLGLRYADRATQSDFFRGAHEPKLMYSVNCTGHESSLSQCQLISLSSSRQCSLATRVGGVICTSVLPDLIPNITAIQQSVSIQDRYMGYLSCSMEENCLASTAYELKKTHPRSWNHLSRRLLRFSSSVYNNGTADFRPRQHKSSWQWHDCHMHYHSMDVFTHYDILDANGKRVAEGHKASFCLEDVECDAGKRKKYSCRGYGDQGISVGCADIYKHNIDCQWIDITDVESGNYVFKVNVNPQYLIPELSFDNNAIICDLAYSGYSVKLTNCKLGRG